MIISAWYLLLLAVPVLLLGEWLVRRISILSRFNIPAPVVGGLLVALIFLIGNVTGTFTASFAGKVGDKWWTWLVTPEVEWKSGPEKNVNLPFLVGFFTCIGLNASWELARRGGIQVLIFLIVGAVLAVIQNGIGVALAKLMDVPPLLGLVCGSTTMTGGHATALGFAPELAKAGLEGAAVLGAAAATFGLIAGGLLGGPLGGALIRKNNLKTTAARQIHLEMGQTPESGILSDMRALAVFGKSFAAHFLLLLICIKLGSWLSYGIQQMKLTFPVYMGAMLLGVLIRNVFDLSGKKWLRTEIIDTMGSVLLGIFLSMAMMGLNFIELKNVAGPMLIILAAQVIVMALFAWFVTFKMMGKDFDAAVMAGGHCGFGLGATPNAVANMKSLVEKYGPAPRAFLVVPIVGAFLLDFLNAINITTFINLVK